MTQRDPFPGTDADLFAYISERANARPVVSWETIAEELGVGVQDLLNWFLAYRQPKRDKRALARKGGGSPMLLATNPGGGQHTLSRDAQRFANWRRSSVAARQARIAD